MYMFEYLMYIFEDQMSTLGYLKIPDIVLKLDWTYSELIDLFMFRTKRAKMLNDFIEGLKQTIYKSVI